MRAGHHARMHLQQLLFDQEKLAPEDPAVAARLLPLKPLQKTLRSSRSPLCATRRQPLQFLRAQQTEMMTLEQTKVQMLLLLLLLAWLALELDVAGAMARHLSLLLSCSATTLVRLVAASPQQRADPAPRRLTSYHFLTHPQVDQTCLHTHFTARCHGNLYVCVVSRFAAFRRFHDTEQRAEKQVKFTKICSCRFQQFSSRYSIRTCESGPVK